MRDCVIYFAIVTHALLGIKNFVHLMVLRVVVEIVHLTNGVCIVFVFVFVFVFVPAVQM